MFFEILKLFLPKQNHPKLKDTNKHQGLRNQLVKQLEEKGITDKNVLAAISKVARHLFFFVFFEDFAYQDKAFPIGAGQTISQPYTVAFQSQLLEVQKDHKILDIFLNKLGFNRQFVEEKKENSNILGIFKN